ncbi:MAG: hypothetical protein COV10_00015 [Candidatus Vogelbacteria bacterium CG10_big_fil_rev_8_21_14_0_10_51_16]|uniref:Uncharacterized protein n=1 Tax=Candidatus Vogelbacteria bacterium CG10_big_fil_rev_8_21_14_0_10_51_16 TaxID=1975045 RepID=A0A2H0RFC5_9BACT|nr:MAG: hypothetical protein COV10_00015 [Candidatus Vogelbacteria bacterium CG10_big_fil_rev_8_21_14_0_10_51_16]
MSIIFYSLLFLYFLSPLAISRKKDIYPKAITRLAFISSLLSSGIYILTLIYIISLPSTGGFELLVVAAFLVIVMVAWFILGTLIAFVHIKVVRNDSASKRGAYPISALALTLYFIAVFVLLSSYLAN